MTFASVQEIIDYIDNNSIKFIDFRFTDSIGRWHHVTHSCHSVDNNTFIHGIMFDGSSIPGWKPVEDSDMILLPDLKTAFVDPFTAQTTLVLICDIKEVKCNSFYSLSPRFTAQKACEYMKNLEIADQCLFGPEMEFFIFDDVRFTVSSNFSCYEIDSIEGNYNSNRRYDFGNNGYRPKINGGYMPVPPVDSLHDLRSEMLSILTDIKINSLIHHHEVASSQCEIGFKYDNLLESADNVQKCKYVIRNVANSYGKSATFMAKPVYNENGSGMHCHQSLRKKGKNLFVGEDNKISETCLYYIGGILKHGRAINAFANPSTNSYKRLVPNFEAPVALYYSYSNRSAAIRIPYTSKECPDSKRIEVRFPDPLANPYLCFAAQLMAGIDGIIHKIVPEEKSDTNIYDLLKDRNLKEHSLISNSLEMALDSLDKDRNFLIQGGVFTNEQIDSYIDLKKKEIIELNTHPHPIEFTNYYSL